MLTAWADQASHTSPRNDAEAGANILTLPEELYSLVSAGISNAIDRALENQHITVNIDLMASRSLGDVFMDEICAPAPEISQFLRNHDFIQYTPYSPTLTSREADQRQYEQDVYDFSRDLGLPIHDAEKWVLKAREFANKKDYERMDIEESNDVQDPESTENVVGQYAKANKGEAAVREKEEEAVRRAVKKARKAKPKAEKGASRLLEEDKVMTGEHENADESGGQITMTTKFEESLHLEQSEDKENVQRQKKKAKKRKGDRESLPQWGLQLEGHDEHEGSRANNDAQEGIPKEVKRKKAKVQVSPFFQRGSGLKAKKKDTSKKAKKQLDFQPPMIQ